ncbi:bifunctional diguanylate cyclase/phosphodiesterase [Pseudidiomarina homiensis]|nr:bifunctional diguanylate cyclase/phosphodiesterase [Pseudidiomarina homiensis]
MSLVELIKTQALTTHYQPIIDTYRSHLIGYESLIRGPVGHRLERPDTLFAESEALALRDTLEQYCLIAAVRNFDAKQFSGSLFININPNLLLQPDCLAVLNALPEQTAASIILELSEHYPIENIQELKAQMHRLRAVGYRFAIDDLGAGHSSFKLWAEVRPDYVKLDRYFISDINNSPYKREFVQHIVTLAKNLHATVIAEGIETQEELRQLQKLGIYASQGFLIGRPSPSPIAVHTLTERISHDDVADRYDALSTLLESTTVICSDRCIADILDYFEQNKRLIAIPVVDQGKTVGIIRRGQFMELMSTPFGRPLFARKPARTVMQANFLVVDVRAPLEQASALLTENEDTFEQQILIATNQDEYAGIIPVASLLRRITELKIQNARYANPLTLLPGNVPINQTIDQYVHDGEPFSVLYFDLNFFKPFNDEYGYHRGDAVLQLFANLLEEYFPKSHHFVGHVGGDDFIVISQESSPNLQTLNYLKKAFQEQVKSFYKAPHLKDNGMVGRARNGRFRKFPLLDFCVAIIAIPSGTSLSHQDIASTAAQMKGRAKKAKDGIAVYHTHQKTLSSLTNE